MSTISQTEAQRLQNAAENNANNKKAEKFLLSEVTGAAGVGFAVGYMSAKNPDLEKGIGPGKKLKMDHIVAIGGLWLGRKRTKTGALARGAGLGAAYSLAREQGKKVGTPEVKK